jgi:hypothetical protein
MTTASKKKPKASQSLKQTEFSFLAAEAQGVIHRRKFQSMESILSLPETG